MCGCYQRRSDKQKIAEAFTLGNVDGLAVEFAPDYNAAPQSIQPVIVWDEDGTTGAANIRLCLPRWAIRRPSWSPLVYRATKE